MKFIELFAGIGGFRYGLESVGTQQGKQRKQEWKSRDNVSLKGNCGNVKTTIGKPTGFHCVYANEIDKYACQIYRKNFGEKELYEGDITKITADDIPDHDLLCGGFPCQAFSIAGKRKGFEDTRGTLFFDIARVLAAKRPRYLLLENVKGLLSHDDGHTFRTILWVLHELRYDVQWQVLNSKDFGVPQNRERVFIIGHLRGSSRPEVFPIRGISEEIGYNNECNKTTAVYFDDSIPEATTRRGRVMNEAGALMANPRGGIAIQNKKIIEKDIATTLDANYYKGLDDHQARTGVMEMIELTEKQSQGCRVYNPNGISSTLAGEAGGQGAKTGLYQIVGGLQKHQTPRDDGISPSLTEAMGKGGGQIPILLKQIRRLTPLECERLQAFPDGWTEGISDTQRYKCLGNALTTNVVTEIGKRLIGEL